MGCTQTNSNNCIGTGWELGICKKGTFVLRRKKEQWSSPYYPEMHWNLFPHLSIIEQGHDLVFKELCLLFELKIWIRLTLKLVWNTLDQKHGMRNCKLSDFISWSTSFRCFSKYPWFLWRIEIGNIDGPKVIGNVWDCEKISRWVSTKSRTSTRSQHQQSTDTNFATLHGFDLNNFGKSIVFDVNRLNQA